MTVKDDWEDGDQVNAAALNAEAAEVNAVVADDADDDAAIAGKQPLDADLTALAALTSPATKLTGIEAGADVTDAANVDSAGAVMNSDTSTASMGFVVDEDAMTSNSATKVPTQQSVKAYVDAQIVGGGGGTVDTVVAGNNIDVDATDPANPIVSVETLTAADISDVTASATELNYTDGVTSAIQTQLDAKQPLDADLTALAALTAPATKLTGIATGATANDTDANLKARANHTGTQSADTITDGTTNKAFLATEKTKLTGIATGATANSTDAVLEARANHTGTQSADTITDGTTNKAYTAAEKTKLAGVSGANTGDQTSIVGITGTAAQFNTSNTDKDFVFTDNAALADATKVPLNTYMKPALAPYPLSDVTTYTISTSAPSYTTPFYYAYAAQAVHFRWSAIFSDISGYGWNSLNGAGGAMAPTPYEVEVWASGDRISFPVYAYGNHDIQILVDDMPLYQSATGTKIVHITNTEAIYYISLQFASARTRKIRLLMPQIGFWGAITDAGATTPGYIWPAEPRYKVAVIADSFFHGTGSTSEGAITAMTMAGQLSMQTGWEFWNVVQGGTGYANPGSGTTTPPGSPTLLDKYGSSARLAALAALPAMDMVLVFGGANDADPSTYPVATVVSNANALWNAIKAARPSTPLIVGGVESGAYPANATNLNTLNTALKAAAVANSNVAAYIDMRNPMWVDGTGNLGSATGDGNADIFVSTDLVHPSHAGWEYEARRFKDALAKVKVPAA